MQYNKSETFKIFISPNVTVECQVLNAIKYLYNDGDIGFVK